MIFKNSFRVLCVPFLLLCFAHDLYSNHLYNEVDSTSTINRHSPRIINIVNFIRQTDYRVRNADSLLFETVKEQINLVNKYNFPATFLFQFDALINPAYQKLMKTRLRSDCEIGAWWEITQPHVQAAGIKWRGEHSWVSHANIAFSTGYTPDERERLVDVYMEKFKNIYGYYPKSVGSWFIDAHTLSYMYERYGIVASSNCKDQVGTDGYTLWGGYWNQAYYPSRYNAYMPAQTVKNQIPVPIFRMLGSDPIYQYDTGIGTQSQGVISLEPVYTESGKNKKWVSYFLESIVNQPSLAFSYAQAGQENSFTWNAMKDGLEMQFPIFDSLRREGKVRIETLRTSGEWFKKQFPVTPATAITTLKDVRNENNKSVWYNSRYYRANLLWEKDGFCFRDIHIFNEKFQSDYLDRPGQGGQFLFFTLPVVDRYYWSTPDDHTGLRIMRLYDNGSKEELVLEHPIVSEPSGKVIKIESSDRMGNLFVIIFEEDRIVISSPNAQTNFRWLLELKVPKSRIDRLPFIASDHTTLFARFKDFNYQITCLKGRVKKGNNEEFVFQLIPDNHHLFIDFTN